jgi:hypothetical protein
MQKQMHKETAAQTSLTLQEHSAASTEPQPPSESEAAKCAVSEQKDWFVDGRNHCADRFSSPKTWMAVLEDSARERSIIATRSNSSKEGDSMAPLAQLVHFKDPVSRKAAVALTSMHITHTPANPHHHQLIDPVVHGHKASQETADDASRSDVLASGGTRAGATRQRLMGRMFSGCGKRHIAAAYCCATLPRTCCRLQLGCCVCSVSTIQGRSHECKCGQLIQWDTFACLGHGQHVQMVACHDSARVFTAGLQQASSCSAETFAEESACWKGHALTHNGCCKLPGVEVARGRSLLPHPQRSADDQENGIFCGAQCDRPGLHKVAPSCWEGVLQLSEQLKQSGSRKLGGAPGS